MNLSIMIVFMNENIYWPAQKNTEPFWSCDKMFSVIFLDLMLSNTNFDFRVKIMLLNEIRFILIRGEYS